MLIDILKIAIDKAHVAHFIAGNWQIKVVSKIDYNWLFIHADSWLVECSSFTFHIQSKSMSGCLFISLPIPESLTSKISWVCINGFRWHIVQDMVETRHWIDYFGNWGQGQSSRSPKISTNVLRKTYCICVHRFWQNLVHQVYERTFHVMTLIGALAMARKGHINFGGGGQG